MVQTEIRSVFSTPQSSNKKPVQFGPSPLQKNAFLRKKCEFLHAKTEGTVFVGKFMVLNVVSAPCEVTRIGIIVSKRYSKKAVIRNRARRLVREAFRLIQNRISPPTWLVVIIRKKISGQKVQQVQQELIGLLKKANACHFNIT